MDVDGLTALARDVLDGNWREGTDRGLRYGFSVPSPRSYPWQWSWDSCFHAIVRRRWDPARSRTELETLLGANRDGFVGHTLFWERPVSWRRAFRYNITTRRALMTGTIAPPVLAWAWRIAVGEPDDPRLHRHHEWLRAHRDLAGDGLLWIIQPDESGMDALPKFDHVWGREAQGLPRFPLLVARNRRAGYDARAIEAAGGPVVCEVLTNVIWSLSEQALGRPSPTPALLDRLWDDRAGRFRDDVRNARHPAGRMPETWDSLAALALPDLPDEIAWRLVEEVLDAGGFGDPLVPLPAVALDDPTYSDRERFALGLHRHWRGPSWVNSAWLVSLGLLRLGERDRVARMARRLADVQRHEGLREYYEPRTGAGKSARRFGWSSLSLEIADPDERAARSFL